MQGAPWVSTMYFDDGTPSAQDCVDAVGAFWGAVDALIDNEVDWSTQADVENVDPVTGNVLAVVATTPVTGTGAMNASALPFASQGLVRWRTGVYIGGREIRGRTFIPGLTATASDNGRPLAANQATINAAAAGLIADANCDLGIWSRANGQIQVVTSGTMWTEFAVLRSRRD